ncbi:MAG: hypothetical protein H0X37_04325 [Herpetosiphonaceae bacterium]|nr:hypothetical protein [Herpetosiphonaceae bacterium]
MDSIWINQHVTPPFYPNADTLANAEAADAQLAQIRTLLDAGIPGEWAVKDSFRSLDLVPLGFRPLFDATWIARPGTATQPNADISGIRWSKVSSATELAGWEAAWRGEPANTTDTLPIFLPELLEYEAVAIIAAYEKGRIVAGAIANHTSEVVGLSNVFVPAEDDARFRAGCVCVVMDLFPARTIVGYEAGSDLTAFQALGFEELGPLRIWVRDIRL